MSLTQSSMGEEEALLWLGSADICPCVKRHPTLGLGSAEICQWVTQEVCVAWGLAPLIWAWAPLRSAHE